MLSDNKICEFVAGDLNEVKQNLETFNYWILKQREAQMKIFIFGIGQYYQNRKQQFFDIVANDEILGFLDNCVE